MIRRKDSEAKVSASSARSLILYLNLHGFSGDTLASSKGIDLETLDQPDHRLPLKQFNALWEEALTLTGDAAIGIRVGEVFNPDEMGVVGHIFFNSQTLHQAMDQYVRLFRLVNESMIARFEVQNGLAHLSYACQSPEDYCQPVMDRIMVLSIIRARALVHSQLKMEYVGFIHDKPEYAKEYQRIFQCPIRFNQPTCEIVFKEHYLNFELPKRNPYLHNVLTRHVESILNKLRPKRSITAKVKQLIAKTLPDNNADAENIANLLNMSRHTLYRKLKLEDQSFQTLVEEVRKQKAVEYLESGNYSLSEIAFLLGFSELSAFSRAFKRWTGMSPAKFVKQ